MRPIVFIIIMMLSQSCGKDKKDYPKLEMSADEVVHALVQIYIANAAININDVSLRDSTARVYFDQISKLVGKPIDVIKSDFQKLQLMPDSLLVLENRALDTLRAIQESQLTKGIPVKI